MASESIELVCREIVELVTEYLGNTLSSQDRARFEQHLLTCPPCTAYLAQMRTTLELAAQLGSASPAAAHEEIPRELADLFRRWHDKNES